MLDNGAPYPTNGHAPYPYPVNGAPHPTNNGEHTMAGPSNGVNGYYHPYDNRPHNEIIVDHLYNAGFQHGEYADTILHAHNNAYRLHAIILSRSPYLAHLMSTSPKSANMHTIYVPLGNFPEITDQGFAVALGYLYSSESLKNLNAGNARAVLAAGCYLGGMEDLCAYAFQECVSSITVDTIAQWVEFIDTLPTPSDGATTPSTPPRENVFGPYGLRLKDEVFHYLVAMLPRVLDVQNEEGGGREKLVQIFARVPFDMFKSAMESGTFEIGSDQERFKFAKAAIDVRKRTRVHGAEETVVLAFGGGNSGSAVHVTRKMRRRALFKVG